MDGRTRKAITANQRTSTYGKQRKKIRRTTKKTEENGQKRGGEEVGEEDEKGRAGKEEEGRAPSE